jgi:hypothetical protein
MPLTVLVTFQIRLFPTVFPGWVVTPGNEREGFQGSTATTFSSC